MESVHGKREWRIDHESSNCCGAVNLTLEW